MKTAFSTSWKASRQRRKQHKYRYEAPMHIKHKFLSTNLSKELRKKHGIRSLEIRNGDETLVMRGKFAGQKAKVLKADIKKGKVTLENLTRKKADGSKVNVFFDPSKLQIIALKLDDLRRLPSKEGKTGESKKSEEKNNAPNKK